MLMKVLISHRKFVRYFFHWLFTIRVCLNANLRQFHGPLLTTQFSHTILQLCSHILIINFVSLLFNSISGIH